MGDRTKDEHLRLREENEKLRAQVEGLKECVGLSAMQILFPSLPYDQLLVLGKKLIDGQGVDAFLAVWRENLRPDSISFLAERRRRAITMDTFYQEILKNNGLIED